MNWLIALVVVAAATALLEQYDARLALLFAIAVLLVTLFRAGAVANLRGLIGR